MITALIEDPDKNMPYYEVSSSNNIFAKEMSKSTFFQSVNYWENLGLITLIKKKIGRYYRMKSQNLLSDASIISVELKKKIVGAYEGPFCLYLVVEWLIKKKRRQKIMN